MIRVLLVVQLATLGVLIWSLTRPPPGQAEARAAATAAAERGRTLEADDAFAAAALAYEQAATLEPTGPHLAAAHRVEALTAIAAAELPARDTWPRLDALQASLQAAGDAPTARLLGLVLARARGLRAEAQTRLAACVEAGDSSPWLAWHAGHVRLEDARLAEAREHFEALVKARPKFGPGWHRLGLVYAADERAEAAIEALQRAVAQGAPGAEADLGRLFMKRSMWAEGLPHLENALRGRLVVPELAELLRLVAAAHFHLKRFDRAAETYRKAWDLEPDPRTLLSAAIALTAGSRPADAMGLLDTLAPRATELPEVLYQQALVARALKQDEKPYLERYLALARGRASEAERVQQAEAALGANPGTQGAPP